jgi:hypothetical protein
MTGDRTAEQIRRPLARVEKKGIEGVTRGMVERINPERREVLVDGRTLCGDGSSVREQDDTVTMAPVELRPED